MLPAGFVEHTEREGGQKQPRGSLTVSAELSGAAALEFSVVQKVNVSIGEAVGSQPVWLKHEKHFNPTIFGFISRLETYFQFVWITAKESERFGTLVSGKFFVSVAGIVHLCVGASSVCS